MEEKDIKQIPEVPQEQEIDLVELVQKIWKEKMLLLKAAGIAIVIALIVAFSLPKEFTTTVRLAPENSDGSGSMGSLGGLAALAGINLNSMSGGDAISPELYPDVVQSTPFLLELFPIEIETKKGTLHTTLYDYMGEHQRKAWWGYILSAPFDLLGWIMERFGSDDEPESDVLDPFYLTKDQQKIMEALQDRISAVVDKKTQMITVSVKMQDPLISAHLTQIVLNQLQEYITRYRTQKAIQDLEFTEIVFEDAKQNYYKAQQAYAMFEDANKHIVSASYRTEQERLKNEMTLTFNLYNSLAQQLEQNKLRVQERTPVYTVIEPAVVPIKASSPKKLLILIGFVFLAMVGVVGYILFRHAFNFQTGK